MASSGACGVRIDGARRVSISASRSAAGCARRRRRWWVRAQSASPATHTPSERNAATSSRSPPRRELRRGTTGSPCVPGAGTRRAPAGRAPRRGGRAAEATAPGRTARSRWSARARPRPRTRPGLARSGAAWKRARPSPSRIDVLRRQVARARAARRPPRGGRGPPAAHAAAIQVVDDAMSTQCRQPQGPRRGGSAHSARRRPLSPDRGPERGAGLAAAPSVGPSRRTRSAGPAGSAGTPTRPRRSGKRASSAASVVPAAGGRPVRRRARASSSSSGSPSRPAAGPARRTRPPPARAAQGRGRGEAPRPPGPAARPSRRRWSPAAARAGRRARRAASGRAGRRRARATEVGRAASAAGDAGGVGSNVTQPKPGNQASTQEWASKSRTTYSPRLAVKLPGENRRPRARARRPCAAAAPSRPRTAGSSRRARRTGSDEAARAPGRRLGVVVAARRSAGLDERTYSYGVLRLRAELLRERVQARGVRAPEEPVRRAAGREASGWAAAPAPDREPTRLGHRRARAGRAIVAAAARRRGRCPRTR